MSEIDGVSSNSVRFSFVHFAPIPLKKARIRHLQARSQDWALLPWMAASLGEGQFQIQISGEGCLKILFSISRLSVLKMMSGSVNPSPL